MSEIDDARDALARLTSALPTLARDEASEAFHQVRIGLEAFEKSINQVAGYDLVDLEMFSVHEDKFDPAGLSRVLQLVVGLDASEAEKIVSERRGYIIKGVDRDVAESVSYAISEFGGICHGLDFGPSELFYCEDPAFQTVRLVADPQGDIWLDAPSQETALKLIQWWERRQPAEARPAGYFIGLDYADRPDQAFAYITSDGHVARPGEPDFPAELPDGMSVPRENGPAFNF